MTEPLDDPAPRAWQGQRDTGAVDATAIATRLTRRLAEERRRLRAFWASAAIIVPSWMAAFWLMPDLRRLAVVGLIVSGWLAAVMFRRSNQTRATPDAAQPCVGHEQAVLARERRFHATLPQRILGPILVVQFAMVTALLTNERFEKNALFLGSLSAFIMTVVVVLTMAYRRSRRAVEQIDREAALLKRGFQS